VRLLFGATEEIMIRFSDGGNVIFGMRLDVVFAFVAGLSEVSDYLVWLCGD